MIVTINGGSSSIKFALYKEGEDLQLRLKGKIDRIGAEGTTLHYSSPAASGQGRDGGMNGGASGLAGQGRGSLEGSGREGAGSLAEGGGRVTVAAKGLEEAAGFLIDWLERQVDFDQVRGIGHRVVHGMDRTHAESIDDNLLRELDRIHLFDPEHLPGEIKLIASFRKRHPATLQVACYDTAFHSTLPAVARLLPIPRRFGGEGVRRYGFHGLSYMYLRQELFRLSGPLIAGGRVIMAHLGNGASMTAMRDGQSIDTSMGFTPAGGFAMSTRTGDLDPGVVWYMLQKEGLNAAQLNELVNHQSGLLGISGTSADMQDLLARESSDPAAAEAVDYFCHQVRKWIGAYTAVLGGLDALVFSGGIGENAPAIRSRVCMTLGFLGIRLSERHNAVNDLLISSDESRIPVYVIPTDEEQMIARTVRGMLIG